MYTKLRRSNQILFTRSSRCLQPLLALIRRQSHRALVLWALEGCQGPLSELAARWPEERRPAQAVQAARLWAEGGNAAKDNGPSPGQAVCQAQEIGWNRCAHWAGRIKMPAARRAILAAHAAAKETTDPVSMALCHAVGQACSTVHVETHAIGLPMYELTALVHLYSPENPSPARHEAGDSLPLLLSRQLETYACRLLYWEQAAPSHPGPWAPFLLKDRPNREQQRYLAQQAKKEDVPW